MAVIASCFYQYFYVAIVFHYHLAYLETPDLIQIYRYCTMPSYSYSLYVFSQMVLIARLPYAMNVERQLTL